MKRKRNSFWVLIALAAVCGIFLGCANTSSAHFNTENLIAWCIVPFDAKERSPSERIEMLTEIGLKRYAYDWRTRHLDDMTAEIQLARSKGIEVSAVWLWVDATKDTVGTLSPDNERLLQIVRETGLQTNIWLSFNGNYFAGLKQSEAVKKGSAMVRFIGDKAAQMSCQVMLYNHGDWFGLPSNQIEIIKALPDLNLGIVYNFHHAHETLDSYAAKVEQMLPYLRTVNLNGMNREGPKILTIGDGKEERDMIKLLMDKGYQGPWGILGHIETEDVRVVLERNLEGLRSLGL